MKFISHRGNLNGPNLNEENNPSYVLNALNKGFDVEIDVWFIDGYFFLGHNEPKYIIPNNFLENSGLWCHAKNLDSLHMMILNPVINCFWHQNDEFTITSKGFIWTYPGGMLTEKSICVLPEKNNKNILDIKNCYGICSDFLLNYKK